MSEKIRVQWYGGPHDGENLVLPAGTTALTYPESLPLDAEIFAREDAPPPSVPRMRTWVIPIERGRALWGQRKEVL